MDPKAELNLLSFHYFSDENFQGFVFTILKQFFKSRFHYLKQSFHYFDANFQAFVFTILEQLSLF